MAATVDELTLNYEEDGQLVVEELGKVILSRGAWTTILFKYRELTRSSGEFGTTKYSLRRYQKRDGSYWAKGKFNISSDAQAQGIIDALTGFMADG